MLHLPCASVAATGAGPGAAAAAGGGRGRQGVALEFHVLAIEARVRVLARRAPRRTRAARRPRRPCPRTRRRAARDRAPRRSPRPRRRAARARRRTSPARSGRGRGASARSARSSASLEPSITARRCCAGFVELAGLDGRAGHARGPTGRRRATPGARRAGSWPAGDGLVELVLAERGDHGLVGRQVVLRLLQPGCAARTASPRAAPGRARCRPGSTASSRSTSGAVVLRVRCLSGLPLRGLRHAGPARCRSRAD